MRNSLFVVLFMLLTIYIISAGVKEGIEKWASRLMPSLIVILLLLIVYVLTLPGAMDGLRAYLIPDFSLIADPSLLVDAMGQAFFSLSLGVGTMLIYGSYISSKENLPTIGSLVALLDVGIAVLAGMLILPAMYVALANGVEIYDDAGRLDRRTRTDCFSVTLVVHYHGCHRGICRHCLFRADDDRLPDIIYFYAGGAGRLCGGAS